MVIYNIPLVFETTIDKNTFAQTTANVFHVQIIELFKRYDCYFGFDLSKYSEYSDAYYYIAQLILNFPKRVILSAGLTYKTDLTAYGGSGYLFYKGEQLNSMIEIANLQNIKDALINTKFDLLGWKSKAE